ncbi:hypothetical protein BDZ85DRAFT_266330 [Elsinoe ampelina]|uniref:Uncharacterized protein n=1 Tax=Elsinoe ampelina TaxID=302913 RepID=A0A6A6G6B1_9PEZI|nr:hypothetical protein BDZ85DRAFT_266330 [Elsinoe ampelina]
MRSVFLIALTALQLVAGAAVPSPGLEDSIAVVLEPGKHYSAEELKGLKDAAIARGQKPGFPSELFETVSEATTDVTVAKRDSEQALEKRATTTHALQANWAYTCPILSHQSKQFKWRVKYNYNTGVINYAGELNIDGWKSPSTSGHTFQANWYHSVCLHFGTKICIWHWEASTGGVTAGETFSLSMTTESNFPGELNPTVTESCVDVGSGGGGVCPAVGGGRCRNDDIRVIPY